MILRNSKGSERSFKVLLEIDEDKKQYLIYQDIMSSKVYAGLKKGKQLLKINDKEREHLNKYLSKISE